MSGTQIFILLITIASLITISVMWNDWLNAKEHEHWQDTALPPPVPPVFYHRVDHSFALNR